MSSSENSSNDTGLEGATAGDSSLTEVKTEASQARSGRNHGCHRRRSSAGDVRLGPSADAPDLQMVLMKEVQRRREFSQTLLQLMHRDKVEGAPVDTLMHQLQEQDEIAVTLIHKFQELGIGVSRRNRDQRSRAESGYESGFPERRYAVRFSNTTGGFAELWRLLSSEIVSEHTSGSQAQEHSDSDEADRNQDVNGEAQE